MQLEDFSFIFMGVLILIILYILIGKYLEHKHVSPRSYRSTSSIRQESAS